MFHVEHKVLNINPLKPENKMARTCKEVMEDLMQAEDIYKKVTRNAMRAALEKAKDAISERAELRARVLKQGNQVCKQAIGMRAARMYELKDILWKKTFEDYAIINILYDMMIEL